MFSSFRAQDASAKESNGAHRTCFSRVEAATDFRLSHGTDSDPGPIESALDRETDDERADDFDKCTCDFCQVRVESPAPMESH